MPDAWMFAGLGEATGGAYGRPLKEAARRYYGSHLYFAGRGEMIPNEDCYCEIDPDGTVDQWGIPTLKFHWKWSEHELNQARHMQHTFRDIIEAMGGKVTSTVQEDGADAIAAPGEIIHEVGGAIMGADPERSVVNQYCRSHQVPNLFVTDGACFVSNADKNPTLSIMAIAWRAADYMVEQMNHGAFA
jgi:choline dehydrogenase-like flavoprotein